MKKSPLYIFFLLLVVLTSAIGSVPERAHAAGFSYYRAITIDHTKVPNTDQSNFPVLISGMYSYLATVANGGKVQSGSGYDIGFYTNSDCTTGKMNWETEKYSATDGTVVYWVKAATLSHTTGTIFYMCYGNSSITTDQSNKTAVWDSNYKLVYHLPDGTTLSANDSTSNGDTGSLIGAIVAAAGQIGGGASISDSGEVHLSSNISFAGGATYTISAWFTTPLPTGSDGYETLTRGLQDHAVLVQNSTSQELGVYDNLHGTQFHGSGFHMNTLANGWHYVTAEKSGSNTAFYIDGTFVGTSNYASDDDVEYIGNYQGDGHQPWGNTDEVRISTGIARSADWIKTEYNNQSSLSTFYSLGSEVGGGVPPRAFRLFEGFKIKLISGELKLYQQ